jgi:hypothetical protein
LLLYPSFYIHFISIDTMCTHLRIDTHTHTHTHTHTQYNILACTHARTSIYFFFVTSTTSTKKEEISYINYISPPPSFPPHSSSLPPSLPPSPSPSHRCAPKLFSHLPHSSTHSTSPYRARNSKKKSTSPGNFFFLSTSPYRARNSKFLRTALEKFFEGTLHFVLHRRLQKRRKRMKNKVSRVPCILCSTGAYKTHTHTHTHTHKHTHIQTHTHTHTHLWKIIEVHCIVCSTGACVFVRERAREKESE